VRDLVARQLKRLLPDQLGDLIFDVEIGALLGSEVHGAFGKQADELGGLLPEGPLYFPADQRTDLSAETQIAELVREQALRLTKEEGPHAVSVEVDELTDKVVRATIFVETESQKQIVVGKSGSVVRQIGTRARPEIEHLLGHPVFLDLKVKARPRWRRDEAMLERLGI